LLDISFRFSKPGSISVYADGADGRLLRNLISVLGSEERAQNAIILTGLLRKFERNGSPTSIARAKRVKEKFEDLVGVPYEDYWKLLDSL
jgi:hypothetical protein